jgi:membrane-associated phospholipid phosphatase
LKNTTFKFPPPADLVNIGYQLFIMILIIFHYFSIPLAPYFLVYHVVIILFLLWLSNTNDNKVICWLRNFNLLIIIPTSFTELHYLVHNVSPVDFDQLLIEIDYAIFGVHPTVWLEPYSHPILIEYLQIVYAVFYFLPIILALILYKRKDWEGFQYFIFIIVFGFYFSYLTYFFVPAIGPRFTLDHLQIGPVTGLWLTEGIRYTLNTLENIQRDAFPSGHTEITLLTMFFAWRYSKPFFWILSVLGISLIASTVILRYHYVIDVVAGILLTIIVLLICAPLYDRLRKLSSRDTFIY